MWLVLGLDRLVPMGGGWGALAGGLQQFSGGHQYEPLLTSEKS